MSWMSPSYHLLQWPENPISRYKVYLYREQGWDTEHFVAGHPVIFIPGNAGSYQQVRSIASSAARQYHGEPGGRAHGMEAQKKLDLFTLDLNEDFSAFHARTLKDQATFIQHSIIRVLGEYDHLALNQRPTQVTLLAHSMGGISARLAVKREDVSSKVDMVLTMSTPHTIPPLTFQLEMEAIYQQIAKSTGPLLISVCGGVSDSEIVSDSCALSSTTITEEDGFSVFTSNIPGVWTGVDHQAMVWCHQVRWLVARVLLSMTKQEERSRKLAVARRWLIGSDQKFNPSSGIAQRIAVTSSNMTILIQSQTERVTELSIQHCNEECHNLTSKTELIPFPKDPNAPFPLPGEGIKAGEVVIAADVTLHQVDGFLAFNSKAQAVVDVGSHLDKVILGSDWSE
ncbi:uncharacterized protein IL334_005896 [Kwoniella shivajii]|uniref:GPI inositol-deacylase n=1 Tax=Kwoniella shivajii TaxID=564305 RepID=A0ABZ1D6G8_9TREE|nr:hypothetical protein IL334_005896 [Kwoniella shivajii]